MKTSLRYFLCFLNLAGFVALGTEETKLNVQKILDTEGLVAFWDFEYSKKGVWTSLVASKKENASFPLYLRRIGDPKKYTFKDWPYGDDESKLQFDASGPLGRAIRFNQGYVYGSVEREAFEGTPLDIYGRQPFTMIAWTKFFGKRHMISGIWDEGGWDKYGGRRQVALFAGLFGQKGAIMHISATGAASYPQSEAPGSQYARVRAIDGQPFENNQWVSVATTFDPNGGALIIYLNGVATPLKMTDPVAQDIYKYREVQNANPFHFDLPIYSSRAFVLKYNGYRSSESGVSEHRLLVDLNKGKFRYERDETGSNVEKDIRVHFDMERKGVSILRNSVEVEVSNGTEADIDSRQEFILGDEVITRLEMRQGGQWRSIGSELRYRLQEGAPFTFGRALGLGSEELDHGSQLYLDGVAVYDRVLSLDEIQRLSFIGVFPLNCG